MIDINEKSKVSIDLKTIVAVVGFVAALVGTYLTAKNSVQQLSIEVERVKSSVTMNNEFRIKWPRGEMGALPDDAEQNIRLTYVEKHLDEIRKDNDKLRLEVSRLKACVE